MPLILELSRVVGEPYAGWVHWGATTQNVAIVGGAAGTFASLGDRAPEVQAGVAKRLGLAPMPVPSRSIVDHFAEFVWVLGLLGATCGKIGREIYILMKTECGEVGRFVFSGLHAARRGTLPQCRTDLQQGPLKSSSHQGQITVRSTVSSLNGVRMYVMRNAEPPAQNGVPFVFGM